LSNLYNLTPATGGYQFINRAGDQYYVYLTTYSLLNPENQDEETYINVYMLGFNCTRSDHSGKHYYDAKSKATILSIFLGFMKQHPNEAFLYVCDNRDGLARNRRITFGRWFNKANSIYEQHNSHINYGQDDWYSAILIKIDNANKERFINAYHYTLQQMLNSRNNG
jgi:hypothetical protein